MDPSQLRKNVKLLRVTASNLMNDNGSPAIQSYLSQSIDLMTNALKTVKQLEVRVAHHRREVKDLHAELRRTKVRATAKPSRAKEQELS